MMTNNNDHRWRNGVVKAVGSSGTKSYILYDDGNEDYMSDGEVQFGKLVYKLRDPS
jgi:hypothetical protein